MKVRRRWLLSAAGAAALAGAGLVTVASGKARIRTVLQRAFGTEIAGDEAAEAFIADYIELQPTLGRAGMHWADLRHRLGLAGNSDDEDRIITAFARSTNAVRVSEAGETLVYIGLDSPYEQPCVNPLSSQWLDS